MKLPIARLTQLLALMTSAGTWRKKLADLSIKLVVVLHMPVEPSANHRLPGGLVTLGNVPQATQTFIVISASCITKVRPIASCQP